MKSKKNLGVCLKLFLSAYFAVSAGAIHGLATESPDWLRRQAPIAIKKLLANISPKDGQPGVVIASPQRSNPDYYFHWIRDSALVMEVIAEMRLRSVVPQEKTALNQMLVDYANLSRRMQLGDAPTGLGEPKFHVDGASFKGPWSRPQNDGPALRAIAMIQFAEQLLDEGQADYVSAHLYDGKLPSLSLIKTDLEYVAHHWRAPSYDLWEEVMGDHFYTRMVQRKAMIRGAALATRLGDPGAAAWYSEQARALEKEIEKHWDASRGLIQVTLNRVAGVHYKASGIDSAIVLGALHGDAGDGFFSVTDERVQSSMRVIEESFRRIYPINSTPGVPGVAIGRYPEDLYAGTDFNGGNPWVLATLAFAEAHYRIATNMARTGQRDQAQRHQALAKDYILRVEAYADADGSLAEQIHRQTGKLISASDLTWNYAAVLTASTAKQASELAYTSKASKLGSVVWTSCIAKLGPARSPRYRRP